MATARVQQKVGPRLQQKPQVLVPKGPAREAALRLLRTLTPRAYREQIDVVHSLASEYLDSDAYEKAIAALTEARDLAGLHVSDAHPCVVSTLDALALAHQLNDDYEAALYPAQQALALRLATTPRELAALRARLRARRDAAPLFDTARFCRNLEAAYVMAWQRAEQGLPPDHLALPAV